MSRQLAVSPAPVGVRILSGAEHADLPAYQGVSYCDAVRRAGQGEALRLVPGSLQVCRWSPVVLGLKAPEDEFESGLAPGLHHPVAGLLLAPLETFPGEPQVVLVRSRQDRLRQLLLSVSPEHLWDSTGHEPDMSAVSLFRSSTPSWKHRLVGWVNHPLAWLAQWPHWQKLTRLVFRSRGATRAYDAVISRLLADMSVCRNSTVIPLLTGQVNVSCFCSGGVTWGLNDPDGLTSGWPWKLYQRAMGLSGPGPERPSPDDRG